MSILKSIALGDGCPTIGTSGCSVILKYASGLVTFVPVLLCGRSVVGASQKPQQNAHEQL